MRVSDERGTDLVLVVSGDADGAALMTRALSRVGVRSPVDVVPSAGAAMIYLAHAERTACSPALVLLDLRGSDDDSLDLLRYVRGVPHTEHIAIVIVVDGSIERVYEGYRPGANSYIHRPITPQDLEDTIQQVGEYWLRLNQRPPPEGRQVSVAPSRGSSTSP